MPVIPVAVTFVNTTSVPLRLEYSSPTCQRRAFGTVRPGGWIWIPTWADQVWVFVDPASGRAVAAHVVRFGDRTVNMP